MTVWFSPRHVGVRQDAVAADNRNDPDQHDDDSGCHWLPQFRQVLRERVANGNVPINTHHLYDVIKPGLLTGFSPSSSSKRQPLMRVIVF